MHLLALTYSFLLITANLLHCCYRIKRDRKEREGMKEKKQQEPFPGETVSEQTIVLLLVFTAVKFSSIITSNENPNILSHFSVNISLL